MQSKALETSEYTIKKVIYIQFRNLHSITFIVMYNDGLNGYSTAAECSLANISNP